MGDVGIFQWWAEPKVVDDKDIKPGTVSATLDNKGRYPGKESNGVVCYDADFYPFGREHTPIVNTCPQNYKFTGKERDAETGNDDFGARYYFDEQNKDTFKRMLADRQRQLLIDKEVIQAIDNALADKANDHPGEAALAELTKIAVDQTVKYSRYQEGALYDPEKDQQYRLQMDIGNLQYNLQREQEAPTERDRLTDYREYLNKVVEVLTPHCHLEITPSQYGK